MEKMVGRIIIVREISEAKDTLFGPFSSERTMQMKSKLWTDILEKAKSLGLVAACKDYKYMRDIYWQNIKRHSLARRENEQQHGKKFQRTPIDDLVYDIIDNTSTLHTQTSLKDHQKSILAATKPVHHSVMLKTDHLDYNFELINEDDADSVDVTIEKVEEEEPSSIQEQSQIEEEMPQIDEESAHEEYEPTREEPSSDDKPHTNGPEGTIYGYDRLKQKMEEGKLKKRKVQLEIDFLELQNYKTQLEVLDLECKLGIKPSKYTKELAKRRKKSNIVFENDDEDSDM